MSSLLAVEAILNEAFLNQARGSQLPNRATEGISAVVAPGIDDGADLVYGVFSYQARGVYGARPLTPRFIRNPAFAIRQGEALTPLVYPEDVLSLPHPLSGKVIATLRVLAEPTPTV